jgi:hypothetical protein
MYLADLNRAKISLFVVVWDFFASTTGKPGG